jgi:hypothetical protein
MWIKYVYPDAFKDLDPQYTVPVDLTNIDTQNPLNIDGDSVYPHDVDFTNSDFTGWIGDTSVLFESPFSTSITNSTATNPKQIVLALNRTTKALQLGLGENNSGDFSNVKISLLGSGGTARAIYDQNADPTKRTSLNAEFEDEVFNSVLIEFYTADPVSLSNITIQKSTYISAQIQGKDENGDFQSARVTSDGFLISADFMLEIAKGNVLGHSIYRKFGRIASIQATTPADCWEYGVTSGAELYTWSTTAAIDSISSSNAADTELISITMLDANYVEFTQTVNLQGQTRVPITPGLRLNRVYNANGSATLGDVYVYENTAIVAGVPTDVTKVRGFFSISGQQSLQSIYTVPAGKSAYLYELKTSMGGRKVGFATYEAYLRTVGSIFLIKDTFDLSATGTSSQSEVFGTPRFFPEKTDFRPLITVDTNDLGFSVSFVLVLVDNN